MNDSHLFDDTLCSLAVASRKIITFFLALTILFYYFWPLNLSLTGAHSLSTPTHVFHPNVNECVLLNEGSKYMHDDNPAVALSSVSNELKVESHHQRLRKCDNWHCFERVWQVKKLKKRSSSSDCVN